MRLPQIVRFVWLLIVMSAFVLAPASDLAPGSEGHSLLERAYHQRDCSDSTGQKAIDSSCCVICVAGMIAPEVRLSPDEKDCRLDLPRPETETGIVPEPLKRPPRSIA
jgi:hypothetical protein